MLIPVILSGGAGTRLWPLSRELYPKQFIALAGEATLLQQAVGRTLGLEAAGPIVVCNEHHRFIVAEQLRAHGVTPTAIVLEPVGRNTAPALALAALTALKGKEPGFDPLLLVMPADHLVKDVPAFHAAVRAGTAAATAGKLVLFGVVPTAAETGYGYLRRAGGAGPAFEIQEFVEKPDAERARRFLASGEYLWNSGLFLLKARAYLAELGRLAPDILECCERALGGARGDLDFLRVAAADFDRCRSDSIDYAVMEKTREAVVVPLAAGWSDVGSWAALQENLASDAAGNVTRGDVVMEDSNGCYLYASSRLVAAVGLTDHVVVETKDAVMVAPMSRVQDVKRLVARLKALGRSETLLHREVFRPWGSYDSVDVGERFQVKRLTVNPGAQLSLQMHQHRAEHWIVVSGTARITCNDKVFLLAENQSTYIPVGATHRIENPGAVPLHVIEVQSGDYLGEDDIVRYEDRYGREGTST